MTSLSVDISPDAEGVARRAAAFLCDTVAAASNLGAICLSGGSTPKRLYELLTLEPFVSRMPWQRLHFFLGDERFVPPEDPRSNFKMIEDALLAVAPISPAQIHPIPTVGLTPEQSADSYERTLREFYGRDRLDPKRPLFDVVLLGLGPDGHTASLLPGQPQQDEMTRWVVPAPGGAPEPRITLTRLALNSAAAAVFLVTGSEKRAALAKLRARDESIPAARIEPTGRLLAFVDEAANG